MLIITVCNKNEKDWIFLTPTVHALLEHSGDLILINNGKGFGSSTESSMKATINFQEFLE